MHAAGAQHEVPENLGGVKAAEMLRDQAASLGVKLTDFITFDHKKVSGI
jgi:hypothetical protein